MKFDVSKFKKAYTDGKKTTFKHEDGHQIILNHATLPKDQLKALNKLPMQAEDSTDAQEANSMAQHMNTGIPGAAEGGVAMLKENYGKQRNPKLEESRKSPKMYADGTQDDTVSADDDTPQASQAPDSSQDPIPDNGPNQSYLPSADTKTGEDFAKTKMPTSSYAGQAQDQPQIDAVKEMQNNPLAHTDLSAPVDPKLMQAMAQGNGGATPTPYSNDYIKGLLGAYGNQQRGAKEQMQAEQALAGAQQKDLADQLKQSQDAQNFLTTQANYHNTEANTIADEIKKGKIKPNQYLSEMKTAPRIITGLSLFLGGLGSGFTHSSNQALDFVNKQIDRDIQGQEHDMVNKQNLMTAHMNAYKDINAAREATRLNYLDYTKNLLDQEAAKAVQGNPQMAGLAAAKYHQASGGIQAERSKALMNLTAMGTVNNASAPEGAVHGALNLLDQTNPELAKQYRSRVVGGLGVADRAIPDEEMKKVTGMVDFNHQMTELRDWASKHSGILPTSLQNIATIKYGHTLAVNARNMYKDAQGLGVLRQGEIPMLEGEVPTDATKFLNQYRVLPQYDAALHTNQNRLNAWKTTYGIRPFPEQQAQQQAPQPRFIKSAKPYQGK